jgi:hypothetical protein
LQKETARRGGLLPPPALEALEGSRMRDQHDRYPFLSAC